MFVQFVICGLTLIFTLINGYPSNSNDERCLNYCSNGGICFINENVRECYCLPEWEGERCGLVRTKSSQDKIDSSQILSRSNVRALPCDAVPTLCLNGGVCVAKNKQYSCICPEAFIGPRCKTESPCINYCKNGGLCTVDAATTDPTCDCDDTDFTGTICQKAKPTTAPPIVTTTPSPLCVANGGLCGSGTCVERDELITCVCPPTHQGDFCDEPIQGPQPPQSTNRPTNVPPTTNRQTNVPPTTNRATNSPIVPGQTDRPQAGVTCEQNPCQNGRPCFNDGASYFCYCGSDYSGINCQTPQG